MEHTRAGLAEGTTPIPLGGRRAAVRQADLLRLTAEARRDRRMERRAKHGAVRAALRQSLTARFRFVRSVAERASP